MRKVLIWGSGGFRILGPALQNLSKIIKNES